MLKTPWTVHFKSVTSVITCEVRQSFWVLPSAAADLSKGTSAQLVTVPPAQWHLGPTCPPQDTKMPLHPAKTIPS